MLQFDCFFQEILRKELLNAVQALCEKFKEESGKLKRFNSASLVFNGRRILPALLHLQKVLQG